ncbi:flippase [Patescibacteria group bacterium]|nr:flippase [Patescibacteria group bacterium]
MQKIISFAYFLYLSSHLVPSQLGAYVWALSFTTLFSIGMDLGLSPILTREASKGDNNDEKYLRNLLGIKIPLIVITTLATFAVLFITKSDWTIRFLVLGAAGVMIFDTLSLMFYSFLRSKQKLGYEAGGIIGFQLITLIGGVILLETTGNIIFVMLALAFSAFVNFIYSAAAVKKKFGYSLKPSYDKKVIKYFFRIMPAFALSGIFIRIYNVSDAVILGYIMDNAAVGLFSIPAKAVTAFQALVPGAFQATIYPAMSNFYVTSKIRLKNLFEKSFNYLGLISVPIALGLYAIADPIIHLIWPKYVAAISTFKIMALALPFIFLAFPTGLLLRACDRQTANTVNRGIITVLSVVLNLILIPIYGVLGAGITFLVVNVILLALDFIFVRKVVKFSIGKLLWYNTRVLLAGVGMAVVVKYLLSQTNFYTAIVIGILTFASLVLILRIVRKDEIEYFRNIISKKDVG